MRIFHLSDLHLGLRLYQYDLYEEQADILRQVVELARRYQPEVLLIAGDLYDKAVPPVEAVKLLDTFLTELCEGLPELSVMMISGNHDSPQRTDCYRAILEKQRVYMVGQPPQKPQDQIAKVVLYDAWGPVIFYLLPFVKPSMLRGMFEEPLTGYEDALTRLLAREKLDETSRNVLVSHQFYVPEGSEPESVARMDSEILTVGNVDAVGAKVLEPFDYAALGHIHRPMAVGQNGRYCGTPMPYSLSEAGQQKGILMVELQEKGAQPVITQLPLQPLRTVERRKGTLEELLCQPCDDYVSLALTNPADTDTPDLTEKLRLAFPHMLELTRPALDIVLPGEEQTEEFAEDDPYAVFCEFLPDMDEQDRALIQDVINTVKGVGQ